MKFQLFFFCVSTPPVLVWVLMENLMGGFVKMCCTTWDVESHVNNGIFTIYQLVQDFFHQQYV